MHLVWQCYSTCFSF